MDTIEIKKMTVTERLQAMEAIWKSLLDEESEIGPPHWHREVLEQRKQKIDNGEVEFLSLEQLKATRKS